MYKWVANLMIHTRMTKNKNLIMKNTINNLRLMPSPRCLPTSQNVAYLITKINPSFTITYSLFTLSTAKLFSRNNKMALNFVSQRPESTFMPPPKKGY